MSFSNFRTKPRKYDATNGTPSPQEQSRNSEFGARTREHRSLSWRGVFNLRIIVSGGRFAKYETQLLLRWLIRLKSSEWRTDWLEEGFDSNRSNNSIEIRINRRGQRLDLKSKSNESDNWINRINQSFHFFNFPAIERSSWKLRTSSQCRLFLYKLLVMKIN